MSHLRPTKQSPLSAHRNKTPTSRPPRQIRRQSSHHPRQPGSSAALAHLPRPLARSRLANLLRVHFFGVVRRHRRPAAAPQGHALTGSRDSQLSSLAHHRRPRKGSQNAVQSHSES